MSDNPVIKGQCASETLSTSQSLYSQESAANNNFVLIKQSILEMVSTPLNSQENVISDDSVEEHYALKVLPTPRNPSYEESTTDYEFPILGPVARKLMAIEPEFHTSAKISSWRPWNQESATNDFSSMELCILEDLIFMMPLYLCITVQPVSEPERDEIFERREVSIRDSNRGRSRDRSRDRATDRARDSNRGRSRDRATDRARDRARDTAISIPMDRDREDRDRGEGKI